MHRLPGAALHALGGASPAPPGLLLPLLFLPSFSPDSGHVRNPLPLICSLLSETQAFPRASRLSPCGFCSRFSASSALGSEAFGVVCLSCWRLAASPHTSSCAACLAASLRALSPCRSSPSLTRQSASFRPEETHCCSSVSSCGHWQSRRDTQVARASFASLRKTVRGGQRVLARRRPASEARRGVLRGRSTTFTGLSPGERVGDAREETRATSAESKDSLEHASPQKSWASRQPQPPAASRPSNLLAASGCLLSSPAPFSFSFFSPSPSFSSPSFICSASRACSSKRDPHFRRARQETRACSLHKKRCGRSGEAARRQERRFCWFRPGGAGDLGRTSLAACDSGGFKVVVSPDAGVETDERDTCAKETRAGREAVVQSASRAEAEEPSEDGGKPRGATASTSPQRLYRHDGWPEEGELLNSQGFALRTYTWWPCKCNPCLASLGRATSKQIDRPLRLKDPDPPRSSSLSSSSSSVSPPPSSSASSFLSKRPSRRWWWRGAEGDAAGGPRPSRKEGQANIEETLQRSKAEETEGNGDRLCLVGEKGELQRDRKTGQTACAVCNTPIRGVVILVHGYGEHCRSHFLQKLQERSRASSAPTETTEDEGRRGTGSDPVEAERNGKLDRESENVSSSLSPSSFTSSVSSNSSGSVSSRCSSLDLSESSSDLPSVFAPEPETSLGSLFYEDSWVHALNERGFLVVGFDLQGHGLSGAWRGLRCVVSELDDFARDALLVVLSTQRRFGRPDRDAFPFHLLGISMGGWTAARALELAGHSETLSRCWALARAEPETPHKRATETGEEDAEGRGASPADMHGEEKEGAARVEQRARLGETEQGAGGAEVDPWGRSALVDATGREGEKMRKERESGEDEDEQQLVSKKTPRATLSPGSHQRPSGVANTALGLTGLILVSPMFDLERRKAKLKWELAKYGILPLAAFFPGVPLELFAPWRRLKNGRRRKRVAEYEQLRLSFQADPLTFKASPPGGLVAAIMRGAQRALEPEEVEKINCENVERVLILHNATDSICDAGGAVQFFQCLGSREKEEEQASGEEETRECGEAERFRHGDLDAAQRPAKRRGQKAPEKTLILLNVGATERSSGERKENLTEQQKSFAAFVERERARGALENSQSAEEAALRRAAGGGQAHGTRGENEKVWRSGPEAETHVKGKVAKARKKENVTFVENVDVWHNLANEPGQGKVFELLDAWLEGDTQRKECGARKEQTEPAERGS
ncbi:UNVERIFIED_CONTAM: hypothetical protein HHA_257500 [Hammondia hammondi]|eukprot:XP_008883235.1 hypothetical protein HHA_257500 [Hammondia hammondi]